MTRNTLFAAIAAAAALTSGQAMAEGYLGTYGREQDNANLATVEAVETARATDGAIVSGQTYGAPIESRAVLAGERPNVAAEQNPTDVYLGTAWRYQENADAASAN